jgi:hypothetical protein
MYLNVAAQKSVYPFLGGVFYTKATARVQKDSSKTFCQVATSQAWLPDGIFSNQKSQFGLILEGIGMVNVGILYDHMEYILYSPLVYFMAIW